MDNFVYAPVSEVGTYAMMSLVLAGLLACGAARADAGPYPG